MKITGKNHVRSSSGVRSQNFVNTEPRLSGDRVLLLVAFGLAAFGLVYVYSASGFLAERSKEFKPDWFFVAKQARLFGIGLAAMVFGMYAPLNLYRRLIKPVLLFFVGWMILRMALGVLVENTLRWPSVFGLFSFQLSEVVRILLIIFVARSIADDPDMVKHPDQKLCGLLAYVGIPILLTYFQPDMSGMFLMAASVGLLLFMGGINGRFILSSAGVVVCLMTMLAFTRSYQWKRLVEYGSTWLAIPADPLKNYHLYQSQIGIGQGGIIRFALGQSKQEMGFLPAASTDFIFSIVSEELGLLGSLAVIAAFMFLFYRGIRICQQQTDRFSFLLGCGLLFSIMLHVLVNIGVSVGVFPVTGLPLPFISLGGSSLIISLWCTGVLYNLSKRSARYAP